MIIKILNIIVILSLVLLLCLNLFSGFSSIFKNPERHVILRASRHQRPVRDDFSVGSVSQCSDGHFLCGTGRCISSLLVCDGDDDCGGADDERNCNPCPSDKFQCDNQRCIRTAYKCDHYDDCGDFSDEKDCQDLHRTSTTTTTTMAPHNCTGSEKYLCANGRCIRSAWRCDHDVDCSDGSDEHNCYLYIQELEKAKSSTKRPILDCNSKHPECRDLHTALKPRARLYYGLNFTGDFVDLDPMPTLPCHHLTMKNRTFKSLKTFGTCVRLYANALECRLDSVAYYPKSKYFSQEMQNNNNGVTFDIEDDDHPILHQTVKSVGPCFDNELDETDSTVTLPRMTTKFLKLNVSKSISFVPDIVYSGMPATGVLTIGNSSPKGPISHYKLGHEGRVEFIRAQLNYDFISRRDHQKEVDPMTELLNIMSFKSRKDLRENDVRGQFIGSRFKPQKNIPFSLTFPQSIWNQKMMWREENKIINFLRQNAEKRNYLVRLVINIDYQNSSSTRPTGLTYWAFFTNVFWSRVYLTNECGEGRNGNICGTTAESTTQKQ